MIAPSGVVLDAASLRQMDVPLGTITRPIWRGRLHAFALPVAVPALVAMAVFAAGSARAVIGVGIYGIGLCSMFTASATYHRWVHTMRAREVWRRTDHAMIYAAIAGSFTPVCLMSLPDRWGLPLLTVMWIGGTASAAFKFAGWRHARLAGGVMYAVLSAVAGAALPALWIRFGALPAALMMVSGAFYGLGALGLNRRWPELRPSVFGYHEVWHVNTVIAAAAHFAAVWLIIA